MGSAQNPDIFFQAREACNKNYDALPAIVEEYMDKVNKKIGTNYGLFNYYGAPDAEHIIIAMGSVCQTIEETIDFLTSKGQKVGVIEVHLYRPFCADRLLEKIPATVKQITVLDRTKEPGSIGEPLYLDIVASLYDSKFKNIPIFSGRYGLGSKNTTPSEINAVYKNAEKKRFTVGIVDDVTNLSLPINESIHSEPTDRVSCKFWGLGADGTVGANKNSIKIIGNHTDKYVQAYFDYDSKKSGGLTTSHLRFGDSLIKSTYLIKKADFVACHNPSYVRKYNMVQDLKDNGTFLLNCQWSDADLDKELPGQVKKYIADHHINFYTIDGIKIGKAIGLGGRINTVLQSAFFTLANIIPVEDAKNYMKEAAEHSYRKKGDKIVQMNFDAIDAGSNAFHKVDVPAEWTNSKEEGLDYEKISDRPEVEKFVKNIQTPINSQEGNNLPVSAFMDYVDGSTPSGSSAHERRKVAVDVPVWDVENCIQCNRCALVCPHAVIRPVALTEAELAKAPKNMPVADMIGMPGYKFAITVSVADCTGCGSCANVCPGKKGVKALNMSAAAEHQDQQVLFDFAKPLPEKQDVILKFKETTVKGSQFKKPLLEFSGACGGCGETPYAKLVTQLFGDRMYIANATGCSSIWGNSSPSTPFTVNSKGQGPAWSNSLFEDAAEFGYGMELAQKALRGRLKDEVAALAEKDKTVAEAAKEWIDTYTVGATNGTATERLVEALTKSNKEEAKAILAEKDFLAKKSQWIFGGDGWAYDIGFGGVDHVLASGQDINILVMDTELYSNTGGQSSKATPIGSTAKFAATGKDVKKKDLAGMAMSYGYVYVAQISMGADFQQTLKAISEAEAYEGPSLVIAYAPCINHGIKIGMSKAQTEEAKAVEAGYWYNFRYNPEFKGVEGKNAFMLDSKAPTGSFRDFLAGENRYASLAKANPERAEKLFSEAEEFAKEKYEYLTRLVTLYGND